MPRDTVGELSVAPQQVEQPRTLRAARKMLTDEFIYALQTRPDTFVLENLNLKDTRSGMVWLVGYGRQLFRLENVRNCSCHRMKLGFFNKVRAWRAYQQWLTVKGNPHLPHIHEAMRLAKANGH